MFYLTKKTKIEEVNVGDQIIVLADFSGIPAGTKGRVQAKTETIVMITWNIGNPANSDGFREDELEYLAFATKTKPIAEG
jgi:hypothetical protein